MKKLSLLLWAIILNFNICVLAQKSTGNLLMKGQDPSIVYEGGYYYLIQSEGSLVIRKSTTIAGLKDAPAAEVWKLECCNVWAPELQYIQGKWYIYYTKDDGNNDNHRMYVLESQGKDPMGPYVNRGKIFDPASDYWAIDGTVLEKEDGSLYFVWSGWPGKSNGKQNLYIAPMSNPYTISGKRVLISEPSYAWECIGMPINEGPHVMKKKDTYFIVYSASGSWTDDYCLGILTNKDGDLLNPASWVKSKTPVFSKTPSAYGPGHHCTVEGPNGECWNLYHANILSGSGWNGRTIRMQKFTWDELNRPHFGNPDTSGILIQ